MEEKFENLEDRLYEKSYTCPICSNKFKAREIKKGKTVFKNLDLGLRGHYEPLMPDYYYVIICDKCGYAAVTKTFNKTNIKHIKNINEKVNKDYKPHMYPLVYDAEVAIDRYKKALYFSHIKGGDISERAYISQKIAFIYGDLKDEKRELEYNLHAYNWYNEAFLEEKFPIMDMEENQYLYNLAYLSYKIGNKDEAKKTLSKVIVKKDLTTTLKEKVEDFIDLLKEDKD